MIHLSPIELVSIITSSIALVVSVANVIVTHRIGQKNYAISYCENLRVWAGGVLNDLAEMRRLGTSKDYSEISERIATIRISLSSHLMEGLLLFPGSSQMIQEEPAQSFPANNTEQAIVGSIISLAQMFDKDLKRARDSKVFLADEDEYVDLQMIFMHHVQKRMIEIL